MAKRGFSNEHLQFLSHATSSETLKKEPLLSLEDLVSPLHYICGANISSNKSLRKMTALSVPPLSPIPDKFQSV